MSDVITQADNRLASLHEAITAIKELAAEAYAKEFPLSGGDVAGALAEAGMLTRDEFIALVEKHDPDVAAALRAGPPRPEPGDFDEDNRIPF